MGNSPLGLLLCFLPSCSQSDLTLTLPLLQHFLCSSPKACWMLEKSPSQNFSWKQDVGDQVTFYLVVTIHGLKLLADWWPLVQMPCGRLCWGGEWHHNAKWLAPHPSCISIATICLSCNTTLSWMSHCSQLSCQLAIMKWHKVPPSIPSINDMCCWCIQGSRDLSEYCAHWQGEMVSNLLGIWERHCFYQTIQGLW